MSTAPTRRFPHVEIPRHMVERSQPALLDRIRAAHQRAQTAQLRDAIAQRVPWPVYVYTDFPYYRVIVRVGGVVLAQVDAVDLADCHTPDEAARFIAAAAHAGYAALPVLPIPPAVTLGEN